MATRNRTGRRFAVKSPARLDALRLDRALAFARMANNHDRARAEFHRARGDAIVLRVYEDERLRAVEDLERFDAFDAKVRAAGGPRAEKDPMVLRLRGSWTPTADSPGFVVAVIRATRCMRAWPMEHEHYYLRHAFEAEVQP